MFYRTFYPATYKCMIAVSSSLRPSIVLGSALSVIERSTYELLCNSICQYSESYWLISVSTTLILCASWYVRHSRGCPLVDALFYYSKICCFMNCFNSEEQFQHARIGCRNTYVLVTLSRQNRNYYHVVLHQNATSDDLLHAYLHAYSLEKVWL